MKRTRQITNLDENDMSQEVEDSSQDINLDPKTQDSWMEFRERKIKQFKMDMKADDRLSNLKDQEDEIREEECREEFETTMTELMSYMQANSMDEEVNIKVQNFLKDIIDSSLTIQEIEDSSGTFTTSIFINSGTINMDWGELFEEDPDINKLSALIVLASIFLPAMIVKYYREFSANNILNLVETKFVTIIWTATVNGRRKTTRLAVPRGEIQHFDMKARHLKKYSRKWWIYLVNPMSIRWENKSGQWIKIDKHEWLFRTNEYVPIKTSLTQEEMAAVVAGIRTVFYFYATAVLLKKPTLRLCYQNRLEGLTVFSEWPWPQEFWYFRTGLSWS